jgi:hypothetical protein
MYASFQGDPPYYSHKAMDIFDAVKLDAPERLRQDIPPSGERLSNESPRRLALSASSEQRRQPWPVPPVHRCDRSSASSRLAVAGVVNRHDGIRRARPRALDRVANFHRSKSLDELERPQPENCAGSAAAVEPVFANKRWCPHP